MRGTKPRPAGGVVVRRGRCPQTFYCGEYKLVPVRELPVAEILCDSPESAVRYWQAHIVNHPYYSGDVESLVVVLLNTRKRVIGHHLVSTGSIDTILVSTLNVFRAAIVANANAIVLMHNHPSGDPCPSEADVKITRDLMRNGMALKIELLDHVIIGQASPTRTKPYASLRELGYFSY